MKTFLDQSWRNRFVLAAQTMTAGERGLLAAAADRGDLRRVIRGVYERSPSPESDDRAARHRDLVYARELVTSVELVYSHASAAAMWRLPRFSPWPAVVHVTTTFATGGRSSRGLARHSVGYPLELEVIEGVRVTTLARTVIDVARSSTFVDGVMAADAALAGVELARDLIIAIKPEALLAELDAVLPCRGSRTARDVLAFADGRSGSPGESLSRVTIARAALPRPKLQYRVVDREGEMFADFCWPELRVIGEFDGQGKYLKERYLDGRGTAQVVLEEKAREDRLRRLGWTVARWGWTEAASVPLLRARLADAGVR